MKKYRQTGVCILSAIFILSASSAFAESFFLGKEAASNLHTARTMAETRERLIAALPSSDGRLLVIGQTDGMIPMLLPLMKTGEIKECTVVLGAAGKLTVEMTDRLRLQMNRGGVREDERKNFVFDNGVLQGKIEGKTTTFRTFANLPVFPEKRVALLNPTIIQEFYLNEVTTPMVTLAMKLLVTFRDHRINATELILFDPAETADFPLELGFSVKLFKEMLVAPNLFMDQLPAKWQVFSAAEHARYFSQYPEAMVLYKDYLEHDPDDASTCIKIAKMAIRDLDVEFALQWVNRAAAIDPAYLHGYEELAAYLYKKDLIDVAERVLLAGVDKFPKSTYLSSLLASFYLDEGLKAKGEGDLAGAAEEFKASSGVAGADSQITGKAKSLLKSLPADRR